MEEGSGVLVLPSRMDKRLAKWKGLYKTLRKIRKVNYNIKVPDTCNEKRIFCHFNSNKPQHRSTSSGLDDARIGRTCWSIPGKLKGRARGSLRR